MSRTLSISAGSGRMYIKKQDPEESGLELIIDFSSTTSAVCISACMTPSGDILTSDSKGNITSFLVKQNRYSQYIRNSPTAIIGCIAEDQILLTKTKTIYLYSQAGKKLNEFNQHYSAIKGLEYNMARQQVMTYSSDCAIIWDTNTWKIVRTLRAKGNYYAQVMFTPDGNSILTCFEDGKLYQWRLSDNKLEKQFGFSNIKNFTVSNNGDWVYGSTRLGEIVCWEVSNPNKIAFSAQAIPGTSSILEIKSLPNELIVLCNNGRLYIIDTINWLVLVELQTSVHHITHFYIQSPTLLLISNGLLHIYNYATLLAYFKKSNEAKLKHGIESALVYTHLSRLYHDETQAFEEPESMPSLQPNEEIVFTKLGAKSLSVSSVSSARQDAKTACQHDLFKNLFSTAKLSPHETRIKHCNLKKILKVKGEYPEKFRPLIWRFLLQLPNNLDSFAGLYQRGTHPDLVALYKSFKAKTQNEFIRTERVTSALYYWSSLLSKVDYVHEIVNCFVGLFPGNDISCFELVMSVVLQWMQHWFEFFPDIPVVTVESIRNIVKFHDPRLFEKLSQTADFNEIIWKLLKTLGNSGFLYEDWVKIMDFLFTDWQNPETLLYIIGHYFIHWSSSLLKLSSGAEIYNFFRTKRKINVKAYMQEVEELRLHTGVGIVSYNMKIPICEGQYPLFTGYPKYKVQSKDELAQEILKEISERENTRSYDAALNQKIAALEENQKDFISRTKALSSKDIIAEYHQELLSNHLVPRRK
jgi:hypothetical protein